MPWFYANAGQQIGPVDDAEFDRLARAGTIQPTTLVWRDGMPDWQTYASTASSHAPLLFPDDAPAPAPPRQVICRECGRNVPADDTMQFGDALICSACKPQFVQKMREGALPPEGPHYAGFWIRVVAKLIDSVIVGIPVVILALVLGLRFSFKTYFAPSASVPRLDEMLSTLALQLGVQAFAILLNGVYTIWFVHKYSATPGKMACGLRVVNADSSKLSLGRNFGRFFAELLSGITCDLGYVVAAFDAQKRALHDFICNTRVIYK